MPKTVILVFLFFCFFSGFCQRMSVQEYVNTYKDFAIAEMKRMGVPAAITLAQGILETESGNSDLVKKSNNHFGIKCKNSWAGGTVYHDDDESGECFRKYNTAKDSYRDHSNFLRGSDRYAFLFELDPSDYKGWAYGLKSAGYATNPKYPQILIKNIEDYNLNQYSMAAVSEMPKIDKSKYKDDSEKDPSSLNSPATQPNEKTYFNGVKAVFAPRGTSLLALATKFNIDLSALLEYNHLEKDGLLEEDGYIYLEKNSLKSFGQGYVAGKSADIPRSSDVVDASVSANQSAAVINNSVKTHEVKPGEGLFAISRKYSVTVEEIKAWNNLQTNDLKVGQQLIISK